MMNRHHQLVTTRACHKQCNTDTFITKIDVPWSCSDLGLRWDKHSIQSPSAMSQHELWKEEGTLIG
jgi:hypothetical protein